MAGVRKGASGERATDSPRGGARSPDAPRTTISRFLGFFSWRTLSAALRALEVRHQRIEPGAEEARFKDLFENIPVGLFRCTPRGVILDANPAFAAIMGCGGERVAGRNFAEFQPHASEFERWREELERNGTLASVESRIQRPDGQIHWVQLHVKALRDRRTARVCYEGCVEDITERKLAEGARERLIEELQRTLGKTKTLAGLLPICASCKKIRDEKGAWTAFEIYIENHSMAQFTHGFCSECAHRLYPEVFLDRPEF